MEKDENKQKRGRDRSILKKNLWTLGRLLRIMPYYNQTNNKEKTHFYLENAWVQ